MNGDTFLFTMKGDDQLTRPLKQAENQMKSLGNQVAKTNKQMGAFGSNLVGTGRNLKRFAMGSLQQAGYQLGDYAVQVANGTSRMQAFGQQAPQFLQIFGPIGSAVGAAVAIFAAYSVAAEKMAGSMGQLQKAMKDLRGVSEDLAMKFQMIKFGVDTEAEAIALRELAHLHLNLAEANRLLAETDDLGSRQRQAEDIKSLKSLIANQQKVVDALNERREALQLAIGLGQQHNAVEIAHARILGDQKRARDAQAEVIRKNALIEATQANATRIANVSAYEQYTQSRVATHQMVLREEVQQTRKSHATQLQIMGQTQQTGLTYVANLKKGYAEYYASRIQGEKDAAAAALLAQNLMKRQFETKVYSGRGGDPRKQGDDYMSSMDYKTIGEIIDELTPKVERVGKIFSTKLSPEIQRARELADSVGMSFENAFMSVVDGTKSAKDAFRLMAADVIKELYRVFVVKKITGFISDFAGMAALPSSGTYTGTAGLPSFAGGGYTGNGARSGGLDGKGGYMAMLHPRETVVDHTKGQGAGVTVVQNINVSTGVQQTVRTEIKSLMPQIAASAKAAVVDAKRRGGSYGRALA